MLLLHGLGTSRHIWRPVAAELAASHEVVTVDLPGFGDSPPLPQEVEPSPPELATRVATVLDELGITSAHLVGNSLGGWVVLELAKRGRADSVALLSPAGLWVNGPPRAGLAGLRAGHELAYRATVNPRVSRILSTRAGLVAALAPFAGHPGSVPAEAALAEMRRFGAAPGFRPTVRALARHRFTGGQTLNVPVNVAFGSRDWLLPTGVGRHRGQLPPSTRWRTPPGWGHVPTYDDPGGVTEFLLDAIAR